jgi:hypothetical protein
VYYLVPCKHTEKLTIGGKHYESKALQAWPTDGDYIRVESGIRCCDRSGRRNRPLPQLKTNLLKADLKKMGLADGTQAGNMMNKKMTHFNSQTGKVNINKHPWSLFSDFWE